MKNRCCHVVIVGISHLAKRLKQCPTEYKSAELQMWHAGNFQVPTTPNTKKVQVGILAKVLNVQELLKKYVWGKWCGAMQLLTRNVGAGLAGIVI